MPTFQQRCEVEFLTRLALLIRDGHKKFTAQFDAEFGCVYQQAPLLSLGDRSGVRALRQGVSRGRAVDGVAALPDQRRRPSPLFRRVGFRITLFGACSAFTHVTACLLAESPKRPFAIEGFDSFVTSTAAPTASGWSDQLPDGTCTHEKPTPYHGALNNSG
jgi:hypothetical protein